MALANPEPFTATNMHHVSRRNKGELKNPGEICQFRWWFKNLNFTLKILINYYFTPNVSNILKKNMTRVEGRLTSFPGSK